MLAESDVQENSRTIRSCRIKWRIHNFCFVPHTVINTVYSPVFIWKGRDNTSTKWRMELVVDDRNGVSFVLYRLRYEREPKFISLNWDVTLTAGKKSYESIEGGFSFKENSKVDLNLQSITEVTDQLLAFEDDAVIVEVFLLVNNEEESIHQSVPPSSGVKYLSEDLQRLKSENLYSLADVTIKVGDREIQAHKAILCRNKVFYRYLEDSKNDVIEVQNLDYEAVDKFVTFLYSGNIDDILVNPSISMMKCVAHFNNEILKFYYIPRELYLSTTIRAKLLVFHWKFKATDFPTDINLSLTNTPIKKPNVDTTWRFTISVQPERDSDDDISLYAEIIEGERPIYFCLDFGALKEPRAVYHSKRLIRVNQRYDNLGYRSFIKKSDLISHIFKDGTIRLVFRIRTANGNQKNQVDGDDLTSVPTVRSSYEELCLDLKNLLENKKYSDIILKFNKQQYHAHRCVLASRSTEFPRIISRMIPNNDEVTLENIEEDTLGPILHYLYSGSLNVDDPNRVEKIYNSASVLGIQRLIEECQRILNAARHND